MADVKKIDGYWIKDASAAADVSINSAGVNIKLRGGSSLLNPINEINVNSATIGDLLVSGGASFTGGATGASGAIVSGDPDYVTGGVVFDALQNAGSGGIDTAVATKATATYLLGQEGTTAKSDSQGPYKYDASVYIQQGGIVTNTVKATTAANQSATKYFATNGTIQDIPNLSDLRFVDATVGGSATAKTITLSTGNPYQLASITGLTADSTTSIVLTGACFPTTNGTAKNIVLIITRSGSGKLDVNFPVVLQGITSIKNFMNTITSGVISTLDNTKTTLELVFTCGKTAAGTYYCSFNGSDQFNSISNISIEGGGGLLHGWINSTDTDGPTYYSNDVCTILCGGGNPLLIAPELPADATDEQHFNTNMPVHIYSNLINIYDWAGMDHYMGIHGDFQNNIYTWSILADGETNYSLFGKYQSNSSSWYGLGVTSNGLLLSGNTATYTFNGETIDGQHHVESFAFKSGDSNSWADIYARAFYQQSDKRIKNIHEEIDLDKAYDLIEKCSTIIYDLKDDPKHKDQIGVIAQEIEEFFPEIVETDENGIKSVNYSRLTVVVMKVLKDVIKRLTSIEEKIK